MAEWITIATTSQKLADAEYARLLAASANGGTSLQEALKSLSSVDPSTLWSFLADDDAPRHNQCCDHLLDKSLQQGLLAVRLSADSARGKRQRTDERPHNAPPRCYTGPNIPGRPVFGPLRPDAPVCDPKEVVAKAAAKVEVTGQEPNREVKVVRVLPLCADREAAVLGARIIKFVQKEEQGGITTLLTTDQPHGLKRLKGGVHVPQQGVSVLAVSGAAALEGVLFNVRYITGDTEFDTRRLPLLQVTAPSELKFSACYVADTSMRRVLFHYWLKPLQQDASAAQQPVQQLGGPPVPPPATAQPVVQPLALLHAVRVVADKTVEADTMHARQFLHTSDERVKRDVVPVVTDSLAELAKVGVYCWKGGAGDAQEGVLAQEVMKALPRCVKEGPDGLLRVDPMALQGHTINAIKQLRSQLQRVLAFQVLLLQALLQRRDAQLPAAAAADDRPDAVATRALALVQQCVAEAVGNGAGSGGASAGGSSMEVDGGPSSALALRLPTNPFGMPAPPPPASQVEQLAAVLLHFLRTGEAKDNLRNVARVLAQQMGELEAARSGEFWQLWCSCVSGVAAGAPAPAVLPRALIKAATQRKREFDSARCSVGTADEPRALRGYQQRAAEILGWEENVVVMLPTGAGKTEVVIEHARRCLQEDESFSMLFLANTVPLVEQQAAELAQRLQDSALALGRNSTRVACYHGGSPMRLGERPLDNAAVVMTPQYALNCLDSGVLDLAAFSLLVVDECHNCHTGDPSAQLMKLYARLPNNARPQVVGLTASIASGLTELQIELKLQEVIERLCTTKILTADLDVQEVEAVVPEVNEVDLMVEERQADTDFACLLGTIIADTALDLVKSCELGVGTPLPQRLEPAALRDLKAGAFSGQLKCWADAAAEAAAAMPAVQRNDVYRCAKLLADANALLQIVPDAGFEAALRYLGGLWLDAAKALADWTAQSGAAAGAHVPPVSGVPCTSMGTHATADAAQRFFPLTAKLLLRLSAVAGVEVVDEAVAHDDGAGGVGAAEGAGGPPKYRALVDKCLARYNSATSAQGLVFVQTRQGAEVLLQRLKADPALSGWQLFVFTGHGGRSARSSGSTFIKGGMTLAEQRHALEQFKQAKGRALMISTPVAEEGIHISKCHFVVRYKATETGIQRVQSRGRARHRNSDYYNIIATIREKEHLEASRNAEVLMKRVMANRPDVLSLAPMNIELATNSL